MAEGKAGLVLVGDGDRERRGSPWAGCGICPPCCVPAPARSAFSSFPGVEGAMGLSPMRDGRATCELLLLVELYLYPCVSQPSESGVGSGVGLAFPSDLSAPGCTVGF